MTSQHLTIQHVTAQTGLSGSTLRYYEQIGILQDVERIGGRRIFKSTDLEWLTMLSILRGTGMPVRKLRELADLKYAGPHTVPERITFFEAYKQNLEKEIETYRHAADIIEHKIEYHKKQVDDRREDKKV